MQKKAKMPKPPMPIGKAGRVKFGGKPKKGAAKKGAPKKGGAKKMPFGATKAPGARKTQPAMKKAMGGKMPAKKARKKKSG